MLRNCSVFRHAGCVSKNFSGNCLILKFWAYVDCVCGYVLFLESAPQDYQQTAEGGPEVNHLINEIDHQLNSGEIRLRQMERYITSDSYSINNKFRQL